MSNMTRVYLITGFLGSGKTTFLNRIIDRFPKDKRLMILMNEFGEIGIDGTLIESDDLEIMEISKGSIFCVCVKTDFIKGLYEISQKMAPDVLIIESTGVANPSDLKRDLQLPLFKNRFQFTEQFCLIDARNFLDAYGAFASLEKQIASSTRFLINKIDLAPREMIEAVKSIIGQFHPNPEFHETSYADVALDQFFPDDQLNQVAAASGNAEVEDSPPLTNEQLDAYIDEALEVITADMTPPDLLMSAAYQWTGSSLQEVEAVAARLPAGLLRAKGFLNSAGTNYLFSYVMGQWSIEPSAVQPDRIQHQNIVVFIGSPDVIAALEAVMPAEQWQKVSTYQPMA